jgi:hypothetical protein
MIYEIVFPTKSDPDHVYIKPKHCSDAWDAYAMLSAAFPYDDTTHNLPSQNWQFFICNFSGFENCIQFVKNPHKTKNF